MQDDDYVYSFTPRRIDGPRHVADDREELRGMQGVQVGAEQCDGCGNNVYTITYSGTSWWAVCSLDESPDEFTHTAPCGARYQITLTRAGETVF